MGGVHEIYEYIKLLISILKRKLFHCVSVNMKLDIFKTDKLITCSFILMCFTDATRNIAYMAEVRRLP